MDKEKLIEMLDEDEYAYHVYPHYGMILDWYKAYWRLHNALRDYLDVPTEGIPK